ncbi:ankyrin [Piromyces finnis]|uniref:Ankyrin n=1 Tax=Piromyces finnis TaxID=1754191 RepID=A0A1Y1V968_9FUNG|nr:ankyrin [Piromyces finnis]|eukprot:ORX49723.1 ankyrin [Piromyces finnis]
MNMNEENTENISDKQSLNDLLSQNNLEKIKEFVEKNNLNPKNFDLTNNNPLLFSIDNSINSIIEYFISIYENENLNFEIHTGETPLFISLKNENFYISDILLNKGANINYINRFNETVLIYLFKKKLITEKSLNYLLKHGINVNLTDISGNSGLIYSLYYQNEIYTKKIISYYVFDKDFILNLLTTSRNKLTLKNKDLNYLLEQQYNRINVNNKNINGDTALLVAIKQQRKNFVRLLLNGNADINCKDIEGKTPIIYAAEQNDFDLLSLLIQLHGDVNETGNNCKSALNYACEKGNINIVKLLLKNNADVNNKDIKGKCPLITSCEYGFENIVELLLTNNKININDTDSAGRSSLIYSCRKGNINIAKMLIEYGINVFVEDKFSNNAFYYATEKGYYDILKLLLQTCAVSESNKIDKKAFGGSDLLIATINNRVKIINLLLEMNVNIDETNRDGKTPLTIACIKGNENLVDLFLQHGANVNCKDNMEKTPLIYACEKGYSSIAQLLISYGANVNEIDYKEETALFVSCEKGYYEIVQLLLDNGAFVNEKGGIFNYSPIIIACKNNKYEIIKLLIKYGANINDHDIEGKTVLIHAAILGLERIINLLLANNAIVYTKDNKNKDAVEYAKEKKYSRIITLLQN